MSIRASLTMVALEQVSASTHTFRAGHDLGGWVASQSWTFDGGDAIVSVIGSESDCAVFLRQGDVVKAYRATGVVGAMKQAGLL